jgi:hypothetical protein
MLSAAAFGAVAGHSLTYTLAVPDAATRRLFLSSTGHSYWPAAVPAALVLGIFAAVSTLVRHFGGDAGAPRRWRWGRVVGALGLIQLAIFLSQETLERAVAHAPLASLLQDHVLPIGILVQLIAAAVVAVVLFVLARTAQAVAAAWARRRRPAATSRSFPADRLHVLRPRLVVAGAAIRGPPLLLTR